MLGIEPDCTRQDGFRLLPSCVVDTNESLRQRALRLVTLGCSQKILAAKMGMQASTFSRWLNQKDDIGPVSVTALDGFNGYIQELRDALDDTIRQPSVSGLHGRKIVSAGSATNEKEPDGRPLAPTIASGQADSVPPAPAQRSGSLRAQVMREVAAVKERRTLDPPARSPRTPRQSAATAHHKGAGTGVRDRKHRR